MTNLFTKKTKDFETRKKLLNCANYVFLDEMENFEFKKISRYPKSRYMYDRVVPDFRLVNELIAREDLINAAVILRATYENIIYIIATSYDKSILINIDIKPGQLRKVLTEHNADIFTEYFDDSSFSDIYNHLCKFVHPNSMKEFSSYINKTKKYKDYMLCNIKYLMIEIQYMYLNFLNKKAGYEESNLDLDFILLCEWVNLVNIGFLIYDVKDSESFTKKYFCHDLENKTAQEKQETLKSIYKDISDNKDVLNEEIKEILKELDNLVNASKYKDIVAEMLK